MTNIAIRGAVLRQPADGSRVIRFRASTPRVDRHGTSVRSEGINVEDFSKNPVFCWGHDAYGGGIFGGTPDMESVIGRVIAYDRSPQAFDVDVEFATADQNPKAERAFRLVKGGFLNAVSIGFIPMKWEDAQKGEGDVPVRTFTEVSLAEISLVTIPSCPDALALSRHFFGGTAEQRRYDLEELESLETILRAGAVLNRANKGKLTQAATLINEVLATAASEETDEGRAVLYNGDPSKLGTGGITAPGQNPIKKDSVAEQGADPENRASDQVPVKNRAEEDEDEEEGPGVYIARPVKEADARKLKKWAKERGITDIVEGLHVTVVASRATFDPDELGDDDEEVTVKIKGIKRLKESIVLTLDAPKIVSRHKSARDKGASHDFNSFQPHITLTYSGPDNEMPEDFPSMTVKLGPEFRREFEAETKSLNSAPPAIAADIGAAASAALRAYLMETAISDGIKRALKAA